MRFLAGTYNKHIFQNWKMQRQSHEFEYESESNKIKTKRTHIQKLLKQKKSEIICRLELAIPDSPGASGDEGGGATKRPAWGFRGGGGRREAQQAVVSKWGASWRRGSRIVKFDGRGGAEVNGRRHVSFVIIPLWISVEAMYLNMV